MQWRNRNVNLKRFLVNTRQEVAALFHVIELIKAQKLIQIYDLVVLAEDVVGGPDVANVFKPLLVADNKNTDLDPSFTLLFSRHTHSDCPKDTFRHLNDGYLLDETD